MSSSDCNAPEGTILIVTGSDLRAERMDRPLAYYIQQQIEKSLPLPQPPTYVVSDCRYLYQIEESDFATISVGGPGVNALAHTWLKTVPYVFASEDEFYLQMSDPGEFPVCASIWGVDHETTKLAVATFVERYLVDFLALCQLRVHDTA